ncbi:MAG: hypothetical protein NVSMB3_15520 [Acidobacteriaceae bacterium]
MIPTHTLYVATTNPGKLRDFALAATPGVTLVPLPGLAGVPEAPENEPTFLGNATSKALFYSSRSPGLLIVADDSGLEVDALHGAPGVRSARYADDLHYTTRRPLPPDQRNNLCLLDALASTREADRLARYRCVLVAARDGVVLSTGVGAVEGEILAIPRGNGGFGYDPLFLLPGEGRTMAELAPAERIRFSHRGRALQALLANLHEVQLFAQS